jgi:hypothetical protein
MCELYQMAFSLQVYKRKIIVGCAAASVPATCPQSAPPAIRPFRRDPVTTSLKPSAVGKLAPSRPYPVSRKFCFLTENIQRHMTDRTSCSVVSHHGEQGTMRVGPRVIMPN